MCELISSAIYVFPEHERAIHCMFSLKNFHTNHSAVSAYFYIGVNRTTRRVGTLLLNHS